jgi:hypothetical protein
LDGARLCRSADQPQQVGNANALVYSSMLRLIPRRSAPQNTAALQNKGAKTERKRVFGTPLRELVSTSHIEKQNHTLRMHCRRLTRLTNAFSKKLENFQAAVSLNFAYYNFCKVHGAIRCTPAMEAGIEKSQWTVAELVERCGE